MHPGDALTDMNLTVADEPEEDEKELERKKEFEDSDEH